MAYRQYSDDLTVTPTYKPYKNVTPVASKSDPTVLALQKKLAAAGYNPGPLDGIMGPKTQAAQTAYNNSATTQKTTPIISPMRTTTAPVANTTPTFDQAKIDKLITDFDAARNQPIISQPITGVTSAPSITSPTTETTTDTSAQDYIKQLSDALRTSRISALDTAKNNALSNLDSEQASIAPQYYNKRNQVAAASDIGAMNFAQYMASKGIKGNAGAMPEIYRNAGLQNQIGALDRQEQAANDAIERNRTGIENNYQSDVSTANADVEAQALKAYIDQMNADRAYALQEAGVTGTLNGTPTLAAQNQNFDQNLAANQFKYNVLKDGRDYNYQVSRDQVMDDRWMQQFDYQQQQDILDRALQSRQISNDEYQAKTSRINAETQQRQVNWTVDPNNPDNLPAAKATDYKSDPDFAANIAYIDSDPKNALAEIKNNSAQLIKDYGYDGYKALLDYATNAQY